MFYEITNEKIWEMLQDIKKDIQQFKLDNEKGHNKLMKKIDYTNGKVRLTRWMAILSLGLASAFVSLAIFLITFVMNHTVR